MTGASSDPAGFAITVTGAVAVDDLEAVYPHEHLLTGPPSHVAVDTDLVLDDAKQLLADLRDFRNLGGRTIVELTTPDYGRDVVGLAELSRASGINVIAAAGFNKAHYSRPHVEGRSIEELTERFAGEVLRGVADTGIRCGVIKVGTSLDTVLETEEVVLRASARAHLACGAPIVAHTERGTMAERQLDIFAEEGVGAAAITICHLDFCPDLDQVRRVADRGAFIEFDQAPKAKYALEDEVIRRTTLLSREGFASQILISGDYSRKSYFHHWRGGPGLGYLLGPFRRRLGAALDDAGLDGAALTHDFFYANPTRALSIKGSGVSAAAAEIGWTK
jgi:5-phospho-D-xylono-1,4-lactonase